jgi:hypothetical protein
MRMIHGLGAILLTTAAPLAAGQTSELYISQHNSPHTVVVQGGVVVRSWDTLHPGENALAISGAIRTAANRWSDNGGEGAEYDLAGNPLGPVYASPAAGNWFDGTTDGRYYNYAIQHNGDHNLYRFNRDWTNPRVAFPLPRYSSGVTRDVADETFWITHALNGTIYHLDRAGAELSSFDALNGVYAYGLAMDPADGTLWVGGSSSNVIYQFDREGNPLSTVTVDGVSTAFGMEFDLPPRECTGDFDDDANVDTRDLIAFLNAWASADPAADCDANGAIDTRDMICFLNAWNAGC